MKPGQTQRALRATMSVAAALGLAVRDAVVLNDSNRLVVRLLPCDVVARVSPTGWFSAAREVELARRLAADAPVAELDPRVEPRIVMRDGFEISLWTYFEPLQQSRPLPPHDYATALERLHGSLRHVEIGAPHFTDRLAEVRRWLASGDATPALADEDRALLVDLLEIAMRRSGSAGVEQLLHGEPHPWNVLPTRSGLLFVDFENCARGPVEYDLAWVPDDVSERYRGADHELVGEYRALVLALVTAHRWRSDDQHPSGRRSGAALLEVLRAGPPWPALDAVQW